jgi:hypothetical protein
LEGSAYHAAGTSLFVLLELDVFAVVLGETVELLVLLMAFRKNAQ